MGTRSVTSFTNTGRRPIHDSGSTLTPQERELVCKILRMFTQRPNTNRPEVVAADRLAVRLRQEALLQRRQR